MCIFGIRHHEEQFCEITQNLDQWFRRRCRLKVFLIWSYGGPFVQRSGTICAILVEGIMRNNSVNYFEFGRVFQEKMSFKNISYLAPWWPLLQRSGTFCEKLVEGIMQEEQFCEIILILGQWFRRKCHLKYFLS